jgi:hypothetical protein
MVYFDNHSKHIPTLGGRNKTEVEAGSAYSSVAVLSQLW